MSSHLEDTSGKRIHPLQQLGKTRVVAPPVECRVDAEVKHPTAAFFACKIEVHEHLIQGANRIVGLCEENR